jgi:hypothetical protein
MHTVLKCNYTIRKTKEMMRVEVLIGAVLLNDHCMDHFVNAEY